MKASSAWIFLVGTAITIAWWLTFPHFGWSRSMEVVLGYGIGVLIPYLALFVFLASIGRLPDPNRPRPSRRPTSQRDLDGEYLRRRAEDARMRSLMNPHSQQAPPTDWYGR